MSVGLGCGYGGELRERAAALFVSGRGSESVARETQPGDEGREPPRLTASKNALASTPKPMPYPKQPHGEGNRVPAAVHGVCL